MSIQIGSVTTRNRVFLAPMSGITDAPFRALSHAYGAGLVVSEMVASEELVRARPDMVRRAAAADRVTPFVLQLAGREPRWMAAGARLAEQLGVDIIDINMGCPARQVAGKLSGSALMRDLDHASTLIEATVCATSLPVTLKMRLGWDHDCINAPELAARAQSLGVKMVTVHGRTRNQFYKGRADWSAIAGVRSAISIPLIANGDGKSIDDVRAMMAASGADGVMIGRGAYGRPWWPGVLAEQLEPGSGILEPDAAAQAAIIRQLYDRIVRHYGDTHGVKIARKHVAWALDRWREAGWLTPDSSGRWRHVLVRLACPDAVRNGLQALQEELAGAVARCREADAA